MWPPHLEYTHVIFMFCIKSMQQILTCNKGGPGNFRKPNVLESHNNNLSLLYGTNLHFLSSGVSAHHLWRIWVAYSVCGLRDPFCHCLLLYFIWNWLLLNNHKFCCTITSFTDRECEKFPAQQLLHKQAHGVPRMNCSKAPHHCLLQENLECVALPCSVPLLSWLMLGCLLGLLQSLGSPPLMGEKHLDFCAKDCNCNTKIWKPLCSHAILSLLKDKISHFIVLLPSKSKITTHRII